jgi:hypothetical protein
MKTPLALGFILLLAIPAALHGVEAATPPKPNILFIITDQQFADAMSCRMGTQFLNTPTMDHLARSGMLFTRAYSANPLCMPFRRKVLLEHRALLARFGVEQNDPLVARLLADDVKPIPFTAPTKTTGN